MIRILPECPEPDLLAPIVQACCFARAVDVEFAPPADVILDLEVAPTEHGPVEHDPCAERQEVVSDLAYVDGTTRGRDRALVITGRVDCVVAQQAPAAVVS